ncbi:FkbM family methyltransferase [Nannocystis punicea]|uniref:FkbM family methyltransferase n=1 Tax=Nannocystis punicea TaxID=2995304 RepID=A0ABY7H936_9BACT|nr:FkbM family methyltransferase [Nannocystis poenicansa]WAS95658.1 FkbM family methyltransferase [Nannocystis poenicansa]
MISIVSVHDRRFHVHAGGAHRKFWERVNAGHWEPHTFDVFDRFLTPNRSCLDIGAWIGPTTLYAAQLARRVHAIEPDSVAHAALAVNVAENPALRERIVLHRQCIAPRSGPVELYAGGMYHGEASAFGDSMSGMVATAHRPGQPSCRVDGVALAEFLVNHAIDDCGFIKMDVEGGEYSLIPGRWRELAAFGMPTAYVSFHAPAPALRQAHIGACIEELRRCYRYLHGAAGRDRDRVDQRLSEVRDWTDDSPDSPWRALEHLLGDGLVASDEVW